MKKEMSKYFTKRTKLTFAYFVSMLGLLILNLALNLSTGNLSDNNIDVLFTVISQCICMGIIPFLIALLLTKDKDESFSGSAKRLMVDFGYTKNLNVKQILLLIPLSISFFLITILVSTVSLFIIRLLGYQYPISAGTIYKGPSDLIKWIILTAMLPAIFEEFSHRGLALNALKERGSEASVICVSALLFALMHTNVMQVIYAFVGGLIFGYLAVRTKSIWPSMFLHFMNNTFSCLESYAGQHPDSVLGFLDKISNFFATNMFTALIRIAILLLNVVLFVLLLNEFIKVTEPREAVRGRCIPKTKLDVDFYRPEGKPMLSDNFILYGTIAMCALFTVFTYVWGVLR